VAYVEAGEDVTGEDAFNENNELSVVLLNEVLARWGIVTLRVEARARQKLLDALWAGGVYCQTGSYISTCGLEGCGDTGAVEDVAGVV